ncbi:hemin ABC transporter substrate-binding protein [Gordonia sp. (in: high G+C Gram-positive bacteria)]|jgi:iron complex transport system substrate-binding protein|uniref:heme/hemin ABC transporter substrate-binding protein n=1 Tax=Gordonia sp. (in: high G+C Gram-positive bacteria) TaxID=84139 RepID=UPI001D498845|nr:ABC transporter substrate-binding protein [Gordonia sp. (in: high G+C Gram-positive bacteria)]MCB1296125.1 ABC transporter substrate-binding protein [Gordonia sp. (in: high G+C Gram-positive bacteria)]HMS75950.1 ABC transporter substrate-binding protein [Gordonia sp. (in: high G+C Gram-positive bacteria)]HQV17430.1 ABC transporter substrate-binding protein [Gordonia sp. (in: high G+C Gram-positive bacteria)]
MPDASTSVRARRSARLLFVLITGLVALTVTSCFVTPIDQDKTAKASTAHLRDGPQTAQLPGTDVHPITTDPRPVLPATVTDAGGRKVTVADASRIIAVDINGTLGSIVFSLGLGSRMVGRDTSTIFPAAVGLPVVTNRGHSLNAEMVLKLRPSVLLINQDTTPAGAIDQIRNSGIPVVLFTAIRSLDNNTELIESVADALGVSAEGRALIARTDRQVAEARQLVPNPSGNPTIAFVYVRGPKLTLLAGPGSGADSLIEAIGGVDAGTKADLTGAFTMISAEAMIRADPDVILVMKQGADTVGGPDGVLKIAGIAATSAGRHRRVVQMDETKILAFGPDVGEVIGALAKAVYR